MIRKRSRLRSDSRGKGRLLVMLVLAGCVLLLGLHFFKTSGGAIPGGSTATVKNKTESLLDNRGTIYDRNFKELAVTLEKVSVFADVREVDVEKTSAKLAQVFDVESQHLKKAIAKEHFRAWLAKNISQEEEEEVMALGLPGVHLHKERVRYYPEKETASHIVGFVDKSMGLSGVEYRYNSLLNKYPTLQDMGAEPVEDKGAGNDSGRYLVLTIDLKVQRILEGMVAELGKQRAGSRIAALLMETETGKVIGQAGYPAFDPNRFKDYGWKELDNVLDEPVPVPELVEKLLWDASIINSHYEKSGDVLPWSIHSPERNLGSQLRLWEHLGLNDQLEIDFIKDSDMMAGAKKLTRLAATNRYDSVVEIATPMHIAVAINGLLVGGNRPIPHVIERIAGGDGKVLQLKNKRGKQTVDSPVAEEIRKMLHSQLQPGPVSSGYFETESVSFIESGGERSYRKNSMFFSAIPQEKPELMLFVFAQLPPLSPTRAETKGRFSIAKSANRVTISMVAMEKVMSTLSDMMTAEEKNEMNFHLQREIGKNATVPSNTVAIFGTMPELTGYSLRKSLRLLKDLKLEIQVNGTGVVVEQKPSAGHQVKPGELCRLILKPH